MKFTVKSTDLQKKLDNLHKIAKNKTTLHALDYILIDVNDDIVQFTASDLEVTQTSKVTPESVAEVGSVGVLADTFVETIKKLPDCLLTISEQKNVVVVKSKSGTFKIPSMSSEDFPLTIEPKSDYKISIQSSVIAGAINKTSFATAPDAEFEHFPARCGVFADFKTDKTIFVATDTRRLAVHRSESVSPVEQSVLMSKKFANALVSVFGQSETNIDVSFDDLRIKVESPEYCLYGKLIEAQFPNYNMVLNASVSTIFTVSVDDLLKAIGRVMLYCPFSSSVVSMLISEEGIKLNGENIDFSLSAEEDVPCTTKEGGGSFMINGKWLYETLQKVKTPLVEISFGEHPMVYFNPIDTEEDYLFLIAKSMY